MESGIGAQEKRIRFETSVCGPKCLEKILPGLGVGAKDYKELAKLCKTTDDGTSLENLKRGCETLGLKALGLELNARDFGSMHKPFLWLQGDHYVAVLGIKDAKVHLFDPRYQLEEWRDLPKGDEEGFRATVLAFEVPSSELAADGRKAVKKS